jgi:hypothetical protein
MRPSQEGRARPGTAGRGQNSQKTAGRAVGSGRKKAQAAPVKAPTGKRPLQPEAHHHRAKVPASSKTKPGSLSGAGRDQRARGTQALSEPDAQQGDDDDSDAHDAGTAHTDHTGTSEGVGQQSDSCEDNVMSDGGGDEPRSAWEGMGGSADGHSDRDSSEPDDSHDGQAIVQGSRKLPAGSVSGGAGSGRAPQRAGHPPGRKSQKAVDTTADMTIAELRAGYKRLQHQVRGLPAACGPASLTRLCHSATVTPRLI